MGRKAFHIQAHYLLTLIIAFCLPLGRLVPVFIILLLLNWLVEGDLKNKFKVILENKPALLFTAFFLMHVIGLAYSSNLDSGLFDVQVKLSLFIFPLLFASRPLSKIQIDKVFLFFITGGIACSLIMLSRAVYTYYVFSENNFFYQAFSFLIHPSYLSMYFNLSIAWLLITIFLKPNVFRFRIKVVAVLTILFFSFIVVLLSSKMGLITMLLVYVSVIIYFIVSRKKYFLGLTSLLLLFALIFSLVRFVPEIGGRFNAAVVALSSTSNNQAESESTAVRMLVWSVANKVISENFFFGTGTGDSKDELMKEYEKRGMTGAIEHKLNTHNEYYQVFVSIGLIGFILLVISLLFPLFKAFSASNTIYILFLLIIILNFIPESMLETQAGVMFYAFFNSLFCFSQHKSITNNQ